MVGAAGEIGGELTRRLPDELARAHPGGGYELVAADRRPLLPEVARGFVGTFVDLEITDLDRYTEACAGIDTVVHLAGERRTTAAWESLLPANVLGAYHAFEAARRAGCRRVVFASSVHAVGGYPPDVRIRSDMATAPVNLYGATKVWGESLARVYSEEHGLSCLCLRIGWAGARDDATKLMVSGAPAVYLTYEDGTRLFAACIDAPDGVRFGIFHATSENREARLDLAETRAVLGYEPHDDGFALRDALASPHSASDT